MQTGFSISRAIRGVTVIPRIIQEYKGEVRKKIVEAAYTLFLHNGYHGTTMTAIADSLGVTKTALYQYFPGKEDLMLQSRNTGGKNWQQYLKNPSPRGIYGAAVRSSSIPLHGIPPSSTAYIQS